MKKRRQSRNWGIVLALALLIVVVIVLASTLQPKEGCWDTDSRNPFTGGVVVDARGSIEDSCVDATTLRDVSCTDAGRKSTTVNCAYSCQSGRCVAPDLVIDNVFVQGRQDVGEPFDVVFHVKNVGDYPASPVDLEVFFEPGYGFLTAPPAASLGPGEVSQVRYRVTYKVPGTFRLHALVDPHSLVAESDEQNEFVELLTVSE